jgi:hypothetical protein
MEELALEGRRKVVKAFALAVLIAAPAVAQQLPFSFDAGLPANPALTEQKRLELLGRLPAWQQLPTTMPQVSSGAVELRLFQETREQVDRLVAERDEEREFIAFGLGGTFWRFRGGGSLVLGSTQNARIFYARRPCLWLPFHRRIPAGSAGTPRPPT